MSRRPLLPERAAGRLPCATCGRFIRVGRRGPLPSRCRPCRRPSRAGARPAVGSCAHCGHPTTVPGRRGPLPRTCWWCRRGRRRLADLGSADHAALLAARLEVS